ncbi:nucleotide-binding universal stress UspA family protein [Kibdelosporangium banguiense]|uniref:Nucleotide-binding universal stress UspA family protein n=1 Tax=Kibdelosporangium banguiense TaxID=1365924 RepID=A0ABS4TXP1_9PSEU|nr:universal stress protein [Kibdelosporangium banguiense]MBP2328793.1 nucleotide-binding universal stress UspA family protein [Kibdelosporangium banguiense]
MSKPIVVGVDGSTSAEHAVRWAAKQAAGRHVPLRLVHACMVIEAYTPVTLPVSVSEALAQQGREWLREAALLAKEAAPEVDLSTHLRSGPAAQRLIEESESAGLVVLGSRGLGGFTGLVIGSVAVALSTHGHCPIVVVRGEEDRAEKPVVVGVDGSATSEAAVAFAFEEASRLGVPLVALHAWSDLSLYMKFSLPPYGLTWTEAQDEQRRILDEGLAGWREKYRDVEVRLVVTADRPAHSLLEAARDAQLVVVGSRGRGGLKGMLLGSTSQALLHHAPCAVAVIRPHS